MAEANSQASHIEYGEDRSFSQQLLTCDAGSWEGSDNLQINLNRPDPSSAQKTGECSEEGVALINPASSVTERRENNIEESVALIGSRSSFTQTRENAENQEQSITGKIFNAISQSHQNAKCVMSQGTFALLSFVITCLLAIAFVIVLFPWKQELTADVEVFMNKSCPGGTECFNF